MRDEEEMLDLICDVSSYEKIPDISENMLLAFKEISELIEEHYLDVVTDLWFINQPTHDNGTRFIFNFTGKNSTRECEFYSDFSDICVEHDILTEISYDFVSDVLEDNGILTGTQEYIYRQLKENNVYSVYRNNKGWCK